MRRKNPGRPYDPRRLDHPLAEGVLNGRGQIGDVAIDMREWKAYVEAAGYSGAIEVELFNEGLWARDGREVPARTAERFVAHTRG